MKHQVDYLSLSLLDNFQSDLKEVSLSTNLSIVRLDALSDPRASIILGEDAIKLSRALATKEKYSATDAGFQLLPYEISPMKIVRRLAELSNHVLRWQFVGEVAEPFHENYDRNADLHWFTSALTAMRLLKSGIVGRYPARSIGEPGVSTAPGGIVISGPDEDIDYVPSHVNSSEKYVLETSDIEQLKSIMNAVHNATNTSLRIAVTRFNRLYARANEEDRIIDAVVALEAVYLTGLRDELKFRMAIRIATHMGVIDSVERTRLFTLASTAYDLRSALVHGSLDEAQKSKYLRRGSWATPNALLKDLNDLLRSSLKSILLKTGEQQFKMNFHQELDNSIIRGGTASFAG